MKQLKSELTEWIYPALLCQEHTPDSLSDHRGKKLKNWIEGGDLLTSGIKAQESVFNVRGCPCLCVDARGSMKGSSRGHFRHLLPPRSTHLSICRHGCPSVHTHTHRQTLSSELGGKGFPVCLPLPFTQSFIKQGTTVSAKHNNWKKPEKEGGAFSRGNRNTVGVEKNRHWKINNFLLASNLKARPDGFHAPFLSSSFSSFNFE